MAIPEDRLHAFRKALDEAARPLFFFDGDADGLTSYALLYRYKKEGKGVMISGRPQLNSDFSRKVDEYAPDAVFILDTAQLTQEFVDHIACPMHWLDHHDPKHPELRLPKRMHYYNPRLWDDDDGRPTAYWAYRIVQQDLWIAMAGIIGDYHYDASLAEELRKFFPELLPKTITHQGEALFDSPLGTLIRILNFNLKGPVSSCLTSVKILTRIDHPDEILKQETARGRYLYKRYERVLKHYRKLLDEAMEEAKKDEDYVIFTYEDDTYSLSGELANEVKYRNKDKAVIIGRKHDGKVIMSLRGEHHEVLGPLRAALTVTEGYGGGHPKACGAVVPEERFGEFVEEFKKKYQELRKDV
ncbi:DHH family phosphoesterase [Candidatus Woesearchaeota archaeon]|nr:DHH family phosphoesterase [Candidatus Woesearchaeota archaeon]